MAGDDVDDDVTTDIPSTMIGKINPGVRASSLRKLIVHHYFSAQHTSRSGALFGKGQSVQAATSPALQMVYIFLACKNAVHKEASI